MVLDEEVTVKSIFKIFEHVASIVFEGRNNG